MQHQEKYTLTWHSYSDHLREALTEMMTSSEFADVTLVTDDKQQIRAHRNILSGCSPVFKSILQIDSNSTNPVIYLRGIQHSEMESIMQFIYLGEAKFNEERMSEFLMVSKNLEIKYLSTGLEMNDQTPSDESVEHDNNIADENIDLDEGTTYPFNEDGGEYVVESQVSTKSEIQNKSSNRRATTELVSEDGKLKCQECERIFNSQPALRYHTKSKHEGVKYACNHCDYQATAKSALTIHIQSKHEGVKYACNQCDYQAATQSNLTLHIQSQHLGIKYACNQCDYQTTQQSHLKSHKKRKHI